MILRSDIDRLTELQGEMQKVMKTQLEQQKQMFAHIEGKEKQLSSSVKLSKFELQVLNGNKLEWCEFWDAFDNTVHRNQSVRH